MSWKSKLRKGWVFPGELPDGFTLSDSEKKYFKKRDHPVFLTRYYASLFDGSENDPLRLMSIPRVDEFSVEDWEKSDPLEEYKYQPVSRVIHRYKNRIVLLASTTCALYCRHCFRRNYLGLSGNHNRLSQMHQGAITQEELRAVCLYLKDNQEVEEVLVSGGDPLMLDNKKLDRLFRKITDARPDILLRLGTRMPVVFPMRIDNGLIQVLKRYFPVWVSVHINHPRELTLQSQKVLSRLVKNGIPVVNQAVLLSGVNDNLPVLSELSRKLLQTGIKPYYLFQGDLAEGTSHFRVPLQKAKGLIKALRKEVSGLGMPQYAVDLPDGGGKIPLSESYFEKEIEIEGKLFYQFRSQEGKKRFYPGEN